MPADQRSNSLGRAGASTAGPSYSSRRDLVREGFDPISIVSHRRLAARSGVPLPHGTARTIGPMAAETPHRHTNRLAGETSPYLLQHAHNPVDWHPWGPEALARARELDRPIFLSIGYAACHWCHVMERESFEDDDHGRAAQRLVRRDQGRPRGAARPRRAVHGRGAGDDGPGRLADERVPDAGRQAVLRRHLLPGHAAPRHAVVPAGARGRAPGVDRPAGRGRACRRPASSRRWSRTSGPGPRMAACPAGRCSTPRPCWPTSSSTPSTAAGAGRPSSPSR